MDSMLLSKKTLSFAVTLAGALALSVVLSWTMRGTSRADVFPGEYSMEVRIPAANAALFEDFDIGARIDHGGEPAYQSTQWNIDYDETLIDIAGIASIVKDPAAPSACTSRNDNGTRFLVGCLSLAGPTLTYSGNAWTITAFCIAEGTANFTLTTVSQPTNVSDGTSPQPIHIHNDSIFCGPPPPTDTPTPTNTPPPATSTPTATPTRTPSPTATIDIPPSQNQFEQFAFEPAAFPNGSSLLDAIDVRMEAEISGGWNVVDSALVDVAGASQALSSLQRRNDDPNRRADLTGDDFIDLLDVMLALNAFGQFVTPNAFRNLTIDPSSYPNGAALLAAVDSQMENEIANDWDPVGSTVLTLDGSPKIVFGLQRRNIPKTVDVSGDLFADLTDVLIILQLFSTQLPPSTPVPLPPGPDRFRQSVHNPAAFPNSQALLAALDQVAEAEIAKGYDPADSALEDLDGSPRLVYSHARSLRRNRADLTGDNFIDLQDALVSLSQFGQFTPSIFDYAQVDPGDYGTLPSFLAAVDVAMEGQIALGRDVKDSTGISLDGDARVLFALQRHTIPPTADLNGDEFVDLVDTLIELQLFGTTP